MLSYPWYFTVPIVRDKEAWMLSIRYLSSVVLLVFAFSLSATCLHDSRNNTATRKSGWAIGLVWVSGILGNSKRTANCVDCASRVILPDLLSGGVDQGVVATLRSNTKSREGQ